MDQVDLCIWGAGLQRYQKRQKRLKIYGLELILFFAYIASIVGLSIDIVLPVFGGMAADFEISSHYLLQQSVLVFIVGMLIGEVVSGSLADIYGRRNLLLLSAAIFFVGSLVCLFAQSYLVLLLGRGMQGIGAAGQKIVVRAIIRDTFSGVDMARVSSLIMACMVFIPFVAPLTGQFVAQAFGWRGVFALLAGISLLTFVWGACRLHETLTASIRNRMGLGAVWRVVEQFVVNSNAMGYTIVAGLMFGMHLSFLSMAPIYFRDFYGIVETFPLYFGSVACVFGIALFVNAKTVGRFGLVPMVMFSLSILVLMGGLGAIACLVGLVGGSVGWFLLFSAVALAMIGILFGNIITLALEPCAAAAAWGAALSSAFSTLLAIGVSQVVGASYGGTPTSFFGVLGVCSALSWCIVWWVSRRKVAPIRYR